MINKKYIPSDELVNIIIQESALAIEKTLGELPKEIRQYYPPQEEIKRGFPSIEQARVQIEEMMNGIFIRFAYMSFARSPEGIIQVCDLEGKFSQDIPVPNSTSIAESVSDSLLKEINQDVISLLGKDLVAYVQRTGNPEIRGDYALYADSSGVFLKANPDLMRELQRPSPKPKPIEFIHDLKL
jgi:hypothetical protein